MFPLYRSLEDIQQLYEWQRQMRETEPVWLDQESGFWHIFSYEGVARVVTDYTRFSSKVRTDFLDDSTESNVLDEMNPPRHGQYRHVVSSLFTRYLTSDLSHHVQSVTQQLLDQVRFAGKMDIIADFAYPLPLTIIAEMLGMPPHDRPLLKGWIDGLLASMIGNSDTALADDQVEENLEHEAQIDQELISYFERLCEHLHDCPGTDLISALIRAEEESDFWERESTIDFCQGLSFAGNVTTTALLGQTIRCLAEHPEAMEQLRDDPTKISTAVEEVLRYAPPAGRISRRTTAEVTMHGVTIPANSFVFGWLSSANRDSTQFPDPECFDITRFPNKHLSFGRGIHLCMGAPLARLEAAIALPMLLEQLPNLQLAHEEPPEVILGSDFFYLRSLPVTFTPFS